MNVLLHRISAAWPWLLLGLGALFQSREAWADGSTKESLPQVRDAVFRVETSRAPLDWHAPWKRLPVESVSGTALVIDGDRLLTNAHVVRDAQQVTVKKNDGSAPTLATVEAIDEDCDLAVLRVLSATFLQGIHPLGWRDVPQIGSSVVAYGYPIGGEQLSTTSGVVSRIEDHSYFFGLSEHLVIQTDAALNPGNSGGPVVQDGAVVGVVFQVLRGEQNIGYVIPWSVVRHFLDDGKDGHYDGFPDLPLRFLPLSSPAARRERRLPNARSGVVVQEVAFGSSLETLFRPADVVLSVDGHELSDDGTYSLGGARVPFHYAIDAKAVGEQVRFEVWRDGKVITLQWTACRFPAWRRLHASRPTPRYLVYAGLLFQPLTLEAFAALQPSGPRRTEILREIVSRQWQGPAEPVNGEIVLLAGVFRHPVNARIDVALPAVVRRVNGRAVGSLEDLAQALNDSHDPYDVLEFGPDGALQAIDHEQARAANAAIRATYNILNDKSF
jgi:S1-C subfamily serine protease